MNVVSVALAGEAPLCSSCYAGHNMAYVVRKRQRLVLLHGFRDPKSGKVRQRVLYTFSSQEEVQEALGPAGRGDKPFQADVEKRFADLRFDWPAIRKQLRRQLRHLPERKSAPQPQRNEDLIPVVSEFVKLAFTSDTKHLEDLFDLAVAAANRLQFAHEVIRRRLHPPVDPGPQEPEEPSIWRNLKPECDPPNVARDVASDYLATNEIAVANSAYQVLTEHFPRYAEGHVELGNIANQTGSLSRAIEHFNHALELGRARFVTASGKARESDDYLAQPYIAALRGLGKTYILARSFDHALKLCDRLEQEVHDTLHASWLRAIVYVDLGEWSNAFRSAREVSAVYPRANLLAAIALERLGRPGEAFFRVVHGGLKDPRAVFVLAGVRQRFPEHDWVASWAQDSALAFLRHLDPLMRRHGDVVRRLFEPVRSPPLNEELLLAERLARTCAEPSDSPDYKKAKRQLKEMHTEEYAWARLAELGIE